jgi:hypothetical protein
MIKSFKLDDWPEADLVVYLSNTGVFIPQSFLLLSFSPFLFLLLFSHLEYVGKALLSLWLKLRSLFLLIRFFFWLVFSWKFLRKILCYLRMLLAHCKEVHDLSLINFFFKEC